MVPLGNQALHSGHPPWGKHRARKRTVLEGLGSLSLITSVFFLRLSHSQHCVTVLQAAVLLCLTPEDITAAAKDGRRKTLVKVQRSLNRL